MVRFCKPAFGVSLAEASTSRFMILLSCSSPGRFSFLVMESCLPFSADMAGAGEMSQAWYVSCIDHRPFSGNSPSHLDRNFAKLVMQQLLLQLPPVHGFVMNMRDNSSPHRHLLAVVREEKMRFITCNPTVEMYRKIVESL